jgi:ribosomal protein S18 acetylase RimI-like enzyme
MILSSHAEEELKEKLGTEVLEVSQENFNLFKLYR